MYAPERLNLICRQIRPLAKNDPPDHFLNAAVIQFSGYNALKRVGAIGDEGTPVPISNTVVKLVYGDNTWLATAREDNAAPTQDGNGSCRLFLYSRLAVDATCTRAAGLHPSCVKAS